MNVTSPHPPTCCAQLAGRECDDPLTLTEYPPIVCRSPHHSATHRLSVRIAAVSGGIGVQPVSAVTAQGLAVPNVVRQVQPPGSQG